ncbi:hypothetical protein [Winogradskyella sp.]|uniref:hypothetical protein n=1 Tax=Winogradskyella sp. TaxID=1883156 RepID=UPI0025E80D4A|nr:hypothetical protein [Winogradskyella sp.]MBT8243951.1 hypothetical protein [Winogradskyella sp.]
MKFLFPPNKNTIALVTATVITLLFFVSGVLGILDYLIIKALLIFLTGCLAIVVSVILFKNSLIKNRPEDKLQDDSN